MKNSKETDLEKLELLMQDKPYAELNQEEKEWISQWVDSANEYELLRKSETQLRQYFRDSKIYLPARTTMAQLGSHLNKKTSVQQVAFWWRFKPSLSAWSLAILFGCVGWWIGQSTNSTSANTEVMTSAIVHDTIYIATRPDTIFTERVIFKDRPLILTRNGPNMESKNTSSGSNGINMKEKEELEKLLVSGTD